MAPHATPITERQIALAAQRFIRAKLNVYELKEARAKALADNPCVLVEAEYPPCFRQDALAKDEWCERCQANQPHHEAYRAAAAQKGNALRNLQSVVVRALAQEKALAQKESRP